MNERGKNLALQPQEASFWRRLASNQSLDAAVIVVVIAALFVGLAFWRQQSEIKAIEKRIEENHADLDALHGAIASLIEKNAAFENREPMCNAAAQGLASATAQLEDSAPRVGSTLGGEVAAYRALQQILCMPVKDGSQ